MRACVSSERARQEDRCVPVLRGRHPAPQRAQLRCRAPVLRRGQRVRLRRRPHADAGCALPSRGGVCAVGLRKHEHQMACRPTVRARHAGHPGDHCRSAYTARAFANARVPCCAVLRPPRRWCGSPLGWHDAPLSRVRAVCRPARLAAVEDAYVFSSNELHGVNALW